MINKRYTQTALSAFTAQRHSVADRNRTARKTQAHKATKRRRRRWGGLHVLSLATVDILTSLGWAAVSGDTQHQWLKISWKTGRNRKAKAKEREDRDNTAMCP